MPGRIGPPLGDDGWTEIGYVNGPSFLDPVYTAPIDTPPPFTNLTPRISVTCDITVAKREIRKLRRLIARDYRAEG
jgi:hypothetical protein